MNRKSRKELVKVLSNHFGVQPRYMGAPSFTYAFETSNGIYVVDQNGKVIDSEANLVDLESLLNGLSVSGVAAFADPEDPSNPVAPAEPEASNDHAPSVEAEAPQNRQCLLNNPNRVLLTSRLQWNWKVIRGLL